MKNIISEHVLAFQCIAGACKHNCCIGWEIDIDEDTLELYKNMDGELGEKLRAGIAFDADPPHFIHGPDKRCPLLNSENLCEVIITLTDEFLCNICAGHPYFRNDFFDRMEWGLGLCCEEAARLTLTNKEPMRLITTWEWERDDEEPDESDLYFYSLRSDIFAIMQDREFSYAQRAERLAAAFDMKLPAPNPSDWAELYLGLERLDERWTDCLRSLQSDFTPNSFPQWETAWEQLAVYFLYRHLPEARWDGDVESRIAFALLSVQMLQWLCSAKKDAGFDDLLDFARMYSSEIEYSDENLALLLEAIGGEAP